MIPASSSVMVSTKFSRAFEGVQSRAWGLDGLRHVIQPWADLSYTYSGEDPIHILQFDRLNPSTQLPSDLKERFPHRPVDIVSSTLCAPLADYMPGVRKAIVHDIPRRKLAYRENAHLAAKLKPGHYGTALIMSRKWKAALPSYLAKIPERVGFVGEMRYGVLTDVRYGEKKLPRMIDQCAALALPK